MELRDPEYEIYKENSTEFLLDLGCVVATS